MGKNEECCGNPSQCWEPCGDLGKSEEHVRKSSPESTASVQKALEARNILFTQEEYSGLRNAFHVAMTALHYANRTPEGFHKHDKNLDAAIAEVGTIYKMVKAKGGMK